MAYSCPATYPAMSHEEEEWLTAVMSYEEEEVRLTAVLSYDEEEGCPGTYPATCLMKRKSGLQLSRYLLCHFS